MVPDPTILDPAVISSGLFLPAEARQGEGWVLPVHSAILLSDMHKRKEREKTDKPKKFFCSRKPKEKWITA